MKLLHQLRNSRSEHRRRERSAEDSNGGQLSHSYVEQFGQCLAYVSKVIALIRPIFNHFFPNVQFIGFAVSPGPSQSTMNIPLAVDDASCVSGFCVASFGSRCSPPAGSTSFVTGPFSRFISSVVKNGDFKLAGGFGEFGAPGVCMLTGRLADTAFCFCVMLTGFDVLQRVGREIKIIKEITIRYE
jgi:hypothetical protein